MPRHPTTIRLEVERAFADHRLIEYSCWEIEDLERKLTEERQEHQATLSLAREAREEIDRLRACFSEGSTAHEHTKIELDAMCENHNAVFKALKESRADCKELRAYAELACRGLEAATRELRFVSSLARDSDIQVSPQYQMGVDGIAKAIPQLEDLIARCPIPRNQFKVGLSPDDLPKTNEFETCKHGTMRTMYDAGVTSADCVQCAAEAFGHQSGTKSTTAYMDTPHYRVNRFASAWRCLSPTKPVLTGGGLGMALEDLEAVVRESAPLFTGECVHQVGREVLDLTVPICTDVRMPDDGQECVFLSKGGYWHAGRYLGAARFDRPANTFVGVGLSQCASTVTHWMPVPDVLRHVAGKKS